MPREKALILDDFSGIRSKGAMDINSDGIPELWHGQLVKATFLSTGRHKDMPKIQIKQEKQCIHNDNKLVKEITKQNNDNLPDNDVQIFLRAGGLDKSFKDVTALTGTEIKPDNLFEKKNLVIPKVDCEFIKGKTFIANLQKLAKKAQVYVSAGNKGEFWFNYYGLADGVKTVGGHDITKTKAHIESGNNSLIGEKDWAPYEFAGSLLKDENGMPIGYDIAPLGEKGDGEADLLLSEIKLSGDKSPDEQIRFRGTSFSMPYKAGKDCLARQKGEEEWNPADDGVNFYGVKEKQGCYNFFDWAQ